MNETTKAICAIERTLEKLASDTDRARVVQYIVNGLAASEQGKMQKHPTPPQLALQPRDA